jgi:opacity protein-like surface antigen
VFAYQAGVGVGYPFTDHLILDVKYAYLATEDPEFEALSAEVDAHRVTVGLRYSF